MKYETTNPEALCKCGHRKENHYHGKGMCEMTRGYGFTCYCNRFSKNPSPRLESTLFRKDSE